MPDPTHAGDVLPNPAHVTDHHADDMGDEVKRADLEKLKGKKIIGRMHGEPLPDRYGQGSSQLPDRRERRRQDQAAGRVPLAVKLDGQLVADLQELARARGQQLDDLVAQLLRSRCRRTAPAREVERSAAASHPRAHPYAPQPTDAAPRRRPCVGRHCAGRPSVVVSRYAPRPCAPDAAFLAAQQLVATADVVADRIGDAVEVAGGGFDVDFRVRSPRRADRRGSRGSQLGIGAPTSRRWVAIQLLCSHDLRSTTTRFSLPPARPGA